ncbi:DUF4345 domain-containing protein [Vibrio sp. JC009]|uniref:DUF4345 domain-containing protein n=1 Tax=Vibrio sp. JC009 TaxID=2912314 RepID=UPI0023AEE3A0|nr:DUF4345 domain-containing protein [Vibrio sp. JC009]WED20528.1 DUF4345 domain-containing protein [Vibrio sp. JC009]
MPISRYYLLACATIIACVGIIYGIKPDVLIPALFNIENISLDMTHIFRAVMGLYVGMSLYWFYVSFKTEMHRQAIVVALFFLTGLATARITSIFIDGLPGYFLLFYLSGELMLIGAGLYSLRKLKLET